MRALVLAGGFPQIDLIKKLKKQNIEVIVADYNEAPVAKEYADKHYQKSTLDVDAIKMIALSENVSFLITVCTDQALLTAAKISEDLGLPCYIDYKTALNVTNKAYMKKVFKDNSIPSANYVIANSYDDLNISDLKYPLIVKPVDCNSSKGVIKVNNEYELKESVNNALVLSRTKTAIIEEYITGIELSVDIYVEDRKAKVLDITTSEKLKLDGKFIIFRTWHSNDISQIIKNKVQIIAQQIADSFGIYNSPMLIQMLISGEDVYVIEFSARTGGGVKHLSIKERSGVDVISAVIDLTLGKKTNIVLKKPTSNYLVDEYIYCKTGIFDHLEGFKELKESGIILDYYQFRPTNSICNSIESSGDRICGFSIQGNTIEEMKRKHDIVNDTVSVKSTTGDDIMRHDLISEFNMPKF